jgi:Holliday junction resolvasome RuvABC endonuclease subunit
MKLVVVGQDPSLRNWGLSRGIYDTTTGALTITRLSLVNPVITKGKQVRQNSLDLESAKQLCTAALDASQGAQAIFVEVPVGSQSSRAMASYGICIGVLGALRATGIPFFEVTPSEVKLASSGIKNASKQQMIAWAVKKHPEAGWPTYMQHGINVLCESKAEHMADATAAIYAGLSCNSFQQMLPFFTAANQEVNYANRT